MAAAGAQQSFQLKVQDYIKKFEPTYGPTLKNIENEYIKNPGAFLDRIRALRPEQREMRISIAKFYNKLIHKVVDYHKAPTAEKEAMIKKLIIHINSLQNKYMATCDIEYQVRAIKKFADNFLVSPEHWKYNLLLWKLEYHRSQTSLALIKYLNEHIARIALPLPAELNALFEEYICYSIQLQQLLMLFADPKKYDVVHGDLWDFQNWIADIIFTDDKTYTSYIGDSDDEREEIEALNELEIAQLASPYAAGAAPEPWSRQYSPEFEMKLTAQYNFSLHNYKKNQYAAKKMLGEIGFLNIKQRQLLGGLAQKRAQYHQLAIQYLHSKNKADLEQFSQSFAENHRLTNDLMSNMDELYFVKPKHYFEKVSNALEFCAQNLPLGLMQIIVALLECDLKIDQIKAQLLTSFVALTPAQALQQAQHPLFDNIAELIAQTSRLQLEFDTLMQRNKPPFRREVRNFLYYMERDEDVLTSVFNELKDAENKSDGDDDDDDDAMAAGPNTSSCGHKTSYSASSAEPASRSYFASSSSFSSPSYCAGGASASAFALAPSRLAFQGSSPFESQSSSSSSGSAFAASSSNQQTQTANEMKYHHEEGRERKRRKKWR